MSSHISVLHKETVQPLIDSAGSLFVDGTLGGGGHTQLLLEALPNAKVIGFDQDQQALERVATRLSEFIDAGRLQLIHANFKEMPDVLQNLKIEAVDGIILDLGYSSMQVDTPSRGLSFLREGPLDMRMDQSSSLTASQIINTYPESELVRIIRVFGEDRFAKRIASAIVRVRNKEPIELTTELAKIIDSAIPKKEQAKRQSHPATKTFQALRIAVNQELEVLEKFLDFFPNLLANNGVCSIISFHSLEDRMVKQRFRYLTDDCICPLHILKCARCHKPPGSLLQKKPIIPSEQELASNPRSRSAKLRVFIRNRNPIAII